MENKVVNYREFEEARIKARDLLYQMNEGMGFYNAVTLDIYADFKGIVKTSVTVHEAGLNTINIMKLAMVMSYANELMATFPYSGYIVKYED